VYWGGDEKRKRLSKEKYERERMVNLGPNCVNHWKHSAKIKIKTFLVSPPLLSLIYTIRVRE
jgi:hypothetical protein